MPFGPDPALHRLAAKGLFEAAKLARNLQRGPSALTGLISPKVRPMIDASEYKNALASFPSGVVIATARGSDGLHQGFTASAFSSVSLSPPLVLVCLARSAACFDTFDSTESFAI